MKSDCDWKNDWLIESLIIINMITNLFLRRWRVSKMMWWSRTRDREISYALSKNVQIYDKGEVFQFEKKKSKSFALNTSLSLYESSDELGIYLRCITTSMADNNLLTMDPTDDSSSLKKKKLRWWHVYPAHSERGVTPSYNHEDKHDGLLRSYTLSLSLFVAQIPIHSRDVRALQLLKRVSVTMLTRSNRHSGVFRSPIDSLIYKGRELSRWVSKLLSNGRLGGLWSNETLDSIVNHRYPDDIFFSLDIGKDVAHNQYSRVRECPWRILFFNRRTKVEFERSLISPSMSETIQELVVWDTFCLSFFSLCIWTYNNNWPSFLSNIYRSYTLFFRW